MNAGIDTVSPHDLEAEKAVIGTILIKADRLNEIEDVLREHDFFRRAHRLIFRAMIALRAERRAIDFLTIKDRLAARHELEDVGGLAYIASLTDGLPATTNIAEYARIVRDRAERRALQAAAKNIIAEAYDTSIPTDALLDNAEQQIMAVSTGRRALDLMDPTQLAARGYPMLETLMEPRGQITGVPTGFTAFDAMTRGLQRGTVSIIGARPSVDRSALALNSAYYAATHGHRVAFFSLEMSEQEVRVRLVADIAGIDAHRLLSGLVGEELYPRLGDALAQIGESGFYLDVTADLGVTDLRRKARQRQAAGGLDLVVVDYLQLLRPHERAENRNFAVADISRALKLTARELDVAVLALSQLSRQEPRRRILSDLRDSGALEHDADLVCFIHRPEPQTDTAELIIAKQRNGPTGTVKLAWRPELTRFENLEPRNV